MRRLCAAVAVALQPYAVTLHALPASPPEPLKMLRRVMVVESAPRVLVLVLVLRLGLGLG